VREPPGEGQAEFGNPRFNAFATPPDPSKHFSKSDTNHDRDASDYSFKQNRPDRRLRYHRHINASLAGPIGRIVDSLTARTRFALLAPDLCLTALVRRLGS